MTETFTERLDDVSINVMNWAWGAECDSTAQKLVLLALADHAGNDGTCYPGTALLAERCGISRGQVRKHLDALEAREYLTRARRRRKDGTLGTYLYKVGDQRASITTGNECADQRAPTSEPARIYSRAEPSLNPHITLSEGAQKESAPKPSPDGIKKRVAWYVKCYEETHKTRPTKMYLNMMARQLTQLGDDATDEEINNALYAIGRAGKRPNSLQDVINDYRRDHA